MPLTGRKLYDYSDYGFQLYGSLDADFDIRPSRADEEEAFLFFWPSAFSPERGFALFNFHCFLKKTGSLDQFARGLGPSMQQVELRPWAVFGKDSVGYSRRIRMGDLFLGAPEVIDFIGGRADLEVTDSHIYFAHHHAHYYTGMLFSAEIDTAAMDSLRAKLLAGIRLV